METCCSDETACVYCFVISGWGLGLEVETTTWGASRSAQCRAGLFVSPLRAGMVNTLIDAFTAHSNPLIGLALKISTLGLIRRVKIVITLIGCIDWFEMESLSS